MSYTKVYSRINWQNEPSTNTPLNETNLNRIDSALNTVDDRVIALDTGKVNVADIQDYVASWTMNETTGVITVTEVDGTQHQFDLNIEKIPVSFTLDANGILTMTTSDGTQFTADIGSMIPVLTFNNSSTVGVTSSGSGVNKSYTFNVVDHSIGSTQMETDYLSNCQTAQNNAQSAASSSQSYATNSRSWAVGGTSTRTGEDTNNAKYWSEQSQAYSQNATAKKMVDVNNAELNVGNVNTPVYFSNGVPQVATVKGITSLTRQQYNALSQAEKMNGTVYNITDENANIASASVVPYSNTSSGLSATNVQGAIDEITDAWNMMTNITFPFTPTHNGTLILGMSQGQAAAVLKHIEVQEDSATSYYNFAYYFSGSWGGVTCSIPLRKGHTYSLIGDTANYWQDRTKFIY